MIKPWKILERSVVYRAEPWFTVERQKVELPDGRVVGDYHRISFPDCAGTVVQVEDGRYMAARQYRHGPGRVSLTLPGGALNPGESPLEGAKRELREETGYEAPSWKPLGTFTMNANYGCGTMYLFLATGAQRTAVANNDDLEESELVFLTRDELRAAIGSGEVAVLAAATAILLATA
jgi:ADP-ribose pyrophosphatase